MGIESPLTLRRDFINCTSMPKESSQSRRRQAAALVAKIVARAVADEEYHSSIDWTHHIRHRDPRYPYYRRRRTVREVYRMIGSAYFRRAYRMDYQSFLRLHEKLSTGIQAALRIILKYELKGLAGENSKPPPIPNGPISTKVRLAVALRYFSGGSPYDIMCVYGISHTAVMDSVWSVVEAVNLLPEFHIEYPKSYTEQKNIARGFEQASAVGFSNCAGAVDGVLIWILKPTKEDASAAGIGRKKILCGRKGKFGLNCQADSDVSGRILDISIVYGGASSDCMAFEASDLFRQLEDGLLHESLVLFGDNAYLNSHFMVTPYPNVSSGSKDDYNFYHSQLRIRVECCFGMLVKRWGILRAAIPHNISISRTILLVHALAKLHNFCINEHHGNNYNNVTNITTNDMVPDSLEKDYDNLMMQPEGYVTMDADDNHRILVPRGLMDCGHHFDDMPRALRRTAESYDCAKTQREQLRNKVINSHMTRPTKRLVH